MSDIKMYSSSESVQCNVRMLSTNFSINKETFNIGIRCLRLNQC